jgi:hypothetical protein
MPRARRSDRNRSRLSHSTLVIAVPASTNPRIVGSSTGKQMKPFEGNSAACGRLEEARLRRLGFRRFAIPVGLWRQPEPLTV